MYLVTSKARNSSSANLGCSSFGSPKRCSTTGCNSYWRSRPPSVATLDSAQACGWPKRQSNSTHHAVESWASLLPKPLGTSPCDVPVGQKFTVYGDLAYTLVELQEEEVGTVVVPHHIPGYWFVGREELHQCWSGTVGWAPYAFRYGSTGRMDPEGCGECLGRQTDSLPLRWLHRSHLGSEPPRDTAATDHDLAIYEGGPPTNCKWPSKGRWRHHVDYANEAWRAQSGLVPLRARPLCDAAQVLPTQWQAQSPSSVVSAWASKRSKNTCCLIRKIR